MEDPVGKQAETRTRLTISLDKSLDQQIRVEVDVSGLVAGILSDHYNRGDLTSDESAALRRQPKKFWKSVAQGLIARGH